MKISFVPLAGLALAHAASAHYLFGRLILDGKWTNTWEYIRQVSPRPDSPPELALIYPQTNPDSLDLRCGRNATYAWNHPKLATIRAGDRVGFAAGEPQLPDSGRPSMYHPGYASAWLSKAPDGDLDSYAGDGEWVKILQVVKREEQSIDFTDPYYAPQADPLKVPWGTFRAESWNFTIPATTPAGKYLLRWEHIFPNKYDAQFYVNCAHVEIINDSGNEGTPGPTVKIPGVYVRDQPDVYFQTYDFLLDHNLSLDTFVPPKPEVWRG